MALTQYINQQRQWYRTIKSTYCLALKEDVIFNSQGLRHLRYDGRGVARSKKEYHKRIKLLPSALNIVKSSPVFSSHDRRYKTEAKSQFVDYWSIRAVVGPREVLVTVILRRIGKGQIIFYSVF